MADRDRPSWYADLLACVATRKSPASGRTPSARPTAGSLGSAGASRDGDEVNSWQLRARALDREIDALRLALDQSGDPSGGAASTPTASCTSPTPTLTARAARAMGSVWDSLARSTSACGDEETPPATCAPLPPPPPPPTRAAEADALHETPEMLAERDDRRRRQAERRDLEEAKARHAECVAALEQLRIDIASPRPVTARGAPPAAAAPSRTLPPSASAPSCTAATRPRRNRAGARRPSGSSSGASSLNPSASASQLSSRRGSGTLRSPRGLSSSASSPTIGWERLNARAASFLEEIAYEQKAAELLSRQIVAQTFRSQSSSQRSSGPHPASPVGAQTCRAVNSPISDPISFGRSSGGVGALTPAGASWAVSAPVSPASLLPSPFEPRHRWGAPLKSPPRPAPSAGARLVRTSPAGAAAALQPPVRKSPRACSPVGPLLPPPPPIRAPDDSDDSVGGGVSALSSADSGCVGGAAARGAPPCEPQKWSPRAVATWVRVQGGGLEAYADTFERNAIAGDALLLLSRTDLDGLGVTAVGHRVQLLRAIAELNARAVGGEPTGRTPTSPTKRTLHFGAGAPAQRAPK